MDRVDGSPYMRALVNQVRQRCAVTTFRTPRNQDEPQDPPRIVPRTARAFDLTGAKTSSLSQALAYRGVRLSIAVTASRATQRNLERTIGPCWTRMTGQRIL